MDYCVICGDYVPEGCQICSKCKKFLLDDFYWGFSEDLIWVRSETITPESR